MTRIWLSTAPLAFRLKGAGGGTVDNRNQRQGLHFRNPKTRPNKPGHLYTTIVGSLQMSGRILIYICLPETAKRSSSASFVSIGFDILD